MLSTLGPNGFDTGFLSLSWCVVGEAGAGSRFESQEDTTLSARAPFPEMWTYTNVHGGTDSAQLSSRAASTSQTSVRPGAQTSAGLAPAAALLDRNGLGQIP
ncbi:MAG TPA: hypothetical protein VN845_02330, partial [Solirubrobacteraceae bacterium]|nr:hypothetical protein [Solirubrobacteraceae bacterium]